MSSEERGRCVLVFSRSLPATVLVPALVALVLLILFAAGALSGVYILALPILWGWTRHRAGCVRVHEKGLALTRRFIPWSAIGQVEAPWEEQRDPGPASRLRIVLHLATGRRLAIGPGFPRLEGLLAAVRERLADQPAPRSRPAAGGRE